MYASWIVVKKNKKQKKNKSVFAQLSQMGRLEILL